MDTVMSPASLQQFCTAASATWLTEWSGMVGRFAARSAVMPHHTIQTTIAGEGLQPNFLKVTQQHLTGASAVCFPQNGYPMSVQHKGELSLNENCHRAVTNKKRGRSCKCKKINRKTDNLINVEYEDKTNSYNSGENKCSDLKKYGEYIGFSDSQHQTLLTNSDIPPHKSVHDFDKESMTKNIMQCSKFLRHYLPPVLIDQLIHLAWNHLSRLVVQRSHKECAFDYQVTDWVKRATAFLQLAHNASERKLALDISGIPDTQIEYILHIVHNHFPLKLLSSLVFPREDFKKVPVVFSSLCKEIYRTILLGSYLTSVNLHSKLCDDNLLDVLSKLSLKELSIGSNLLSEKGVVSGLFGLPLQTTSEVVNSIQGGKLDSYPESPLRKSLQKLDLSSQNLANMVFYIIPIIFRELQYYNPHRNLVQCIQNYERITRSESNVQHNQTQKILKLLTVDMGCSSRERLEDIARICPLVQEISLIVDLNAEQILPVLELYTHLTHLEITYYPSFSSSPPKLNADVLLSLFKKFRSQLRSLSLTGCNISGNVLQEMSQLPELHQLSFADCWLSNPRTMPVNPFPCLQKLYLKFLPPNSTMQLLTMGKGIKNLHLDLKGDEWEGSTLTDAYIKDLVLTGIVKSLQTFTASSSYLTMTSLKTLASLPYLKVIGYLASWGLTEEELCCIDHSGPQHILCLL